MTTTADILLALALRRSQTMCGRYAMYAPIHLTDDEVKTLREIDEEFDLEAQLDQREPQYNIAPTQKAPVLAIGENGIELKALRWGLVPAWSKDVKIGARAINARVETAREKPMFRAAHKDLGIEKEIVRSILRDLVFDTKAHADRLNSSYFSLLRDGTTGLILMRPVHFCLHEGIVGFLRVIALRRSQVFLDQVSNTLGDGLVSRMCAAFESQGFLCKTEIDLAEFDSTLPDIDLLVISEEPTLGYVILVCELKSPVPALWAKDHLRALNKDGVSKAFRQCQRIGEFLQTAEGLAVVRQWLPREGLPNFDHFVVVLEPLVITSHNAGMFFDSMRTPVFGYRTIERMLRASDGDMAYIQHMLRTYCEFVDANILVEQRSAQLEKTRIHFDMVGDCDVINFPPNQWRSDGSRGRHVAEFLASGSTPGQSMALAAASAAGSDRGAALATEQGVSTGQRTVVLFASSQAKMERISDPEVAPYEESLQPGD